jgi:F-type H+-transporting ATPase subunit gamma
MAATITALRRQISSASDLKSVVRVMSSAASAIGQYERSVAALADYARTVELGLSVCLRAVDPAEYMRARPMQGIRRVPCMRWYSA